MVLRGFVNRRRHPARVVYVRANTGWSKRNVEYSFRARIVYCLHLLQATVRSAALGGNIYEAIGIGDSNGTTTTNTATTITTVINSNINSTTTTYNNNNAAEREHLVRTLACILHSAAASQRGGVAVKTGSPTPSSNVQDRPIGGAEAGHLAKVAERLELAVSLVSFLPPAREDGLEGVTKDSVALRPQWCAPSTVTANVCSCLLNLLGGERSVAISEQVCSAGGGGLGGRVHS